MSPPRPHSLRPRTWLLAGVLALALPASLSASILGESIIDDGTFFALIAETGFGYHVNGDLFGPGKSNYPNFVQDPLYNPVSDPTLANAGPRNSYPWGMAWFGNQLYVGTNRNIHCTVGGGSDASADPYCPAGGISTSAIPNDRWYAEIWRYTPSTLDAAGDFGLSGTWARVFRSPAVNGLLTLGGSIPATTPRDVGYRMLKTCDAGGTERLYVATYGLPGAVLYLNSSGSFVATAATPETTVNIPRLLAWQSDPTTFDLGFRALTCFKGNLWTSPTGTPEDPDISFHPKVYRNTNPAGNASWIQVADLKTSTFDTDIEGIFQMEAIGNYLFVSAINRTTGWQLWRGTIPAATTTCGTTAASCPITWEKIIDKGAGRPGDAYVTVPDPTDPTKTIQTIRVSNAVATLGVYQYYTGKYDLYMGVGESGYSEDGLTAAELLRIRDVQTGNKQWELMAGWPRKDWTNSTANPGLKNMTCQTANIKDLLADEKPGSSGGRGGNFPPGLLDDPEDSLLDDCFPATGYGPGMGTVSSTDQTPAYNSFGRENYFWRMAEHKHTFYIGTYGRASLWRLDYDPVIDFTGDLPLIERVFTGGLDDSDNAGVRTLVTTPLGLALGFTNPNFAEADITGKRTGGLEIYIASDLFPGGGTPGIPPVARAALGSNSGVYDANGDGIYDFFAAAGKTTVSIKLVDNGSYSPFGGAPISAYEWYDGDVSASCASPPNYTYTKTKAGETVTFTPTVNATLAKKTYTLRVLAPTGSGGTTLASCDTVTVTATTNLPPTGNITASAPLNPTSSGGGSGGTINKGQLNLIDFDGNGSEAYKLTGTCDGGGEALTSCSWVVGSNTMSPTTCTLTGDKKTCTVVSNVTSPVGGSSSNYGGSNNTISLVITDVNGYSTTYTVRVNVQAVGSRPVCRNVDLFTDQGAPISLDPAAYLLSDGNPICKDGDLNPLTYAIRNPQPAQGVAWADTTPSPGISYLPDVDLTTTDQFLFRANDGTNNSSDTTIRVTINPDSINSVPECESGGKIIPPTTFRSGNTSRVAYNGSITTQGAVVVSAGANVTFESPTLHLQPGFKVAAGGLFQGDTVGACIP